MDGGRGGNRVERQGWGEITITIWDYVYLDIFVPYPRVDTRLAVEDGSLELDADLS